jgi:hypothetical protein
VIDIELGYSAGLWHARGAGFEASHADLRYIDAALERAYAHPAETVIVSVRFDRDALPRWWRQYHAHYFNYELRVTPRGAAA